jgi:hypothetical protein
MTPRRSPLIGFNIVGAPPPTARALAGGLPSGTPISAMPAAAPESPSGEGGDSAALLGEEAVQQAADRSGWGGCFDPASAKVETKWSYVGEGKGEYKPEPGYKYVGHGAGSFEPVPLQPSIGERILVRCTALVLCVVFVLGIAGLGMTFWASRSSPAFDCDADYENWTVAWTPDQQEWCCDNVRRGCGGYINATSASSLTPSPLVPVVPAKPSSTLPPLPPFQAPTELCDSMCAYNGESYSCKERILFAATHDAAADEAEASCTNARTLVVEDCPVCTACRLVETQCVAALLNTTYSTSPTPTSSSADPSVQTSDEHDCDTDYLRWKDVWSSSRAAWCCERIGRGCPPIAA